MRYFMTLMSIALSFDVGDQTPRFWVVGWWFFQPRIIARAAFRRQRRHIAATRNRIKRLEGFCQKVGFLSEADVLACRVDPHPWPWFLAAQVLVAGRVLNSLELWSVIRWYAHNRGYDGNALWAREDSDPDDVKKVQAARKLMDRCGTSTMCETVSVLLEADPKT